MYCATKILLIGDSGDDQQAQRTAITSAEPGWQLDFCESGHAAPEAVRALQPHCIILDSQLPDMSALDCFRAIRSLPGNTMPVLMLTSQDSQSNAAEALKLGLQDYLFKDARGNYLALLPAVLKKALREHRVELAQRSAQESLFELARRFEHLFFDLSDGIVLVDEGCSIRAINPAARRLFGFEDGELCGRPVHLLLQPGEPGRSGAAADAGWPASDGSSCQGRHRMSGRRKDGTALALEVAITELAVEGRRLFACVLGVGGEAGAAAPEAGPASRASFVAGAARMLSAPAGAAGLHSLLLLKFGRFDHARRECGRVAGDQMALQVDRLLRQHTRKSDCLAHLGGGEYALLLAECAPDRAGEIGGKLLDAFRSFRFEWGGRGFTLDLGIGIAALDQRTGDVGALLDAAARVCAGASGSPRFHIHLLKAGGAPGRRPRAGADWVAWLKRAIERDELQLFFQRVEPLGVGASGPHFEVLLRYRDEGGTVHLPHDFIALAERHGMASALDRWVIERLARMPLPAVLARDDESVLSINLSGATLADPDFQGFALHALQSCRLPAHRICFEIREASALGNLPQASRFVRELKLLGYRFALDDFDGGLNSFAYLNSLPVDYLKVNGDVARDGAPQAAYLATVGAVHRVAHAMGIATVAKSVESETELERLRSMGVEYAQGFRLHAPEPLFP